MFMYKDVRAKSTMCNKIKKPRNNSVMHSGDRHVLSSRLSSFWSLSLISDTASLLEHW